MPSSSIRSIATVHKALSNPARLRILKFLSPGREQTVGEIAKALGTTLYTVSHHIQILLDADLLDRRKKGLHVFYRIAKEKHPLLRATLKMFL